MSKTKGVIIFSASNEPPPPFLLYESDDRIVYGSELHEISKQLSEWKSIEFIWVESKNEFMPILRENMDLKIQDFKYLIRQLSNLNLS